jgi:hypothetical protein
MRDPVSEELLQLNQRLLESIATADWAAYEELCDPSLTAFEPEAQGQLVEGLAFHRFYFELGGVPGKHQTTMCSPRVPQEQGTLAPEAGDTARAAERPWPNASADDSSPDEKFGMTSQRRRWFCLLAFLAVFLACPQPARAA